MLGKLLVTKVSKCFTHLTYQHDTVVCAPHVSPHGILICTEVLAEGAEANRGHVVRGGHPVEDRTPVQTITASYSLKSTTLANYTFEVLVGQPKDPMGCATINHHLLGLGRELGQRKKMKPVWLINNTGG